VPAYSSPTYLGATAPAYPTSYAGGVNTLPTSYVGGWNSNPASLIPGVIAPSVQPAGYIGGWNTNPASLIPGVTPYVEPAHFLDPVTGEDIPASDHHQAEDAYRQFDEMRSKYMDAWMHGQDPGAIHFDDHPESDPAPPPAPEPAPKKEGMIQRVKDKIHDVEHKIEDAVHNVEHKVMDKVHDVENKVMDKVHDVEHKVEDVAHAVHDKVSGFFGMIGGLFHKKGKGEGPAGDKHGIGSTVEVTKPDGSKERGHIVGEHGGDHLVQLHTAEPGVVTQIPADAIGPVTSYAPVVGAGVEVLFNGVWFSGYVVALPLIGQEPPLYKVQCHGDEENQITFADEASIRPLLSPEERSVVAGHMKEISAIKEKEDKAKAAANAAAAAAAAAEQAKADFKNKLDGAGLNTFYPCFTDHGYDTEESLEHMHDDELAGFGMKPGHLSKFYKAFPRGTEYVITNFHLKSSAPGIAYRSSKSMEDDSHRLEKFDAVVIGTEQVGGWLKVGNLYLPIEVDGAKVIFPKGDEPKEKPKESVKEKVIEKAEEVAAKVSSGLHSFAHMLHFE
jgi:hypothetical protein